MAARCVRKHEVAKRSLDRIAEYLACRASLGVGLRFLDHAEETFARILRSPRIGRLQAFRSPKLAGVRAWHVRGFRNWLIYYREVEDGVEVLDILHGARDQQARMAEDFPEGDPRGP